MPASCWRCVWACLVQLLMALGSGNGLGGSMWPSRTERPGPTREGAGRVRGALCARNRPVFCNFYFLTPSVMGGCERIVYLCKRPPARRTGGSPRTDNRRSAQRARHPNLRPGATPQKEAGRIYAMYSALLGDRSPAGSRTFPLYPLSTHGRGRLTPCLDRFCVRCWLWATEGWIGVEEFASIRRREKERKSSRKSGFAKTCKPDLHSEKRLCWAPSASYRPFTVRAGSEFPAKNIRTCRPCFMVFELVSPFIVGEMKGGKGSR